MQIHGSSPVAIHCFNRLLANLFDPRTLIASCKASISQIQWIALDLSLAFAMVRPRGLVRSVKALAPL
jgi:hypothetical protein